MPDEYISREAALMKLMQDGCSAKNLQSILDMPAADVAEVVRCASCKYVRPTVNAHTGEQVGIWCALHDILNVSPDDYCSRGEKKGGRPCLTNTSAAKRR